MSTSTTQTVQSSKKSTWLINRNYRFLFVGQTISLLGDQLSTYTIILWIVTIIAVGQSWGPLAISAVLVSSMLPNFLIGPLAGVYVDRWDSRITMIRMDIIRAVLAGLLVLCTGIIPLPPVFHIRIVLLSTICMLVFLSSACSQFFNPAYMSLLAKIVSPEERPQAAGLGQTMQAFAMIVGPLLAAPLLFSFGVQWALLIDALSFIVSFITIIAIRAVLSSVTSSEQSNFWRELKEGLHFSFSNRTIRTIIVASFIATLGAGAFDALYVFFLTGNLHASASLTGVVATAMGLGTIVGAVIAARIAKLLSLENLFACSLAGIGLCLIVTSRLTFLPPALILFLLFGMFLAALRVASGPLLLNETPQTMIGRVFAVLGPTSTIASLVSAMLSGFLASVLLVHLHVQVLGTTFGPIDTIFVGVGLLFVLSALYSYRVLARKEPQPERTEDVLTIEEEVPFAEKEVQS